jgi:hypothetical protein
MSGSTASITDQANDIDRSNPSTRDVGDPGGGRTRNDSMGSEPSEEEIRIRAYRRYLERGGGDGQDFDDWLNAETELKRIR